MIRRVEYLAISLNTHNITRPFSAPMGGLTPRMQQHEGEKSDDEAHNRNT
jgi:hypothetical protein